MTSFKLYTANANNHRNAAFVECPTMLITIMLRACAANAKYEDGVYAKSARHTKTKSGNIVNNILFPKGISSALVYKQNCWQEISKRSHLG